MKRKFGGMMLACVCALSACERSAQNMYDQPRDEAYSANPLFADGASSRVAPAGTLPRSAGTLAGTSSGRRGADEVTVQMQADAARAMPYPISDQLLQRGRERYSIYCLPCHSPVGDGDGRVARLGFPAPPSYHTDRLRSASDRHFYEVIKHGYGVMPSYADRLEPADRWAVIAFIRTLQLSQHADVDALPSAIRPEVLDALARSPQGGQP